MTGTDATAGTAIGMRATRIGAPATATAMRATGSAVAAGVTVRVAHTADLGPAQLARLRLFLFGAFAVDGTYAESDFDHALGGLHVLAEADGTLVAHAAVVGRRLRHGGEWLRCGYVESVAVAVGHRRRGLGATVMAEAERIVGGYRVGALAASDDGVPLYEARGWQRWRGPLTGPAGEPFGDEGVYVWPVDAPLDVDGELTCDWRDGDAW